MQDIRKILDILNEVEVSSNDELFGQIYSTFFNEINTIYHTHKSITNDYTKIWISIYSYEQYNDIKNQVIDLYDIVSDNISPNTKCYQMILELYNYFCK